MQIKVKCANPLCGDESTIEIKKLKTSHEYECANCGFTEYYAIVKNKEVEITKTEIKERKKKKNE